MARSPIKIVPGKTNLLGYLDWEGDTIDESSPPAWTDMDNTSGWIIADDNRVVGEIDWSFNTSKGQYAEEWQSKCNLDDNDVYLDQISIWDKGKGYGSSALNQKHNDWKSKGKDSVTLFPVVNPQGKLNQKRLVDWYKRQGYEKSNKCTHKTNCDSDLSCYLTKTLS